MVRVDCVDNENGMIHSFNGQLILTSLKNYHSSLSTLMAVFVPLDLHCQTGLNLSVQQNKDQLNNLEVLFIFYNKVNYDNTFNKRTPTTTCGGLISN